MSNIIMQDVASGGINYLGYARRLNNMFELSYSTAYTYPFNEINIYAPNVEKISRFWSTGAFSAASQKNRGVSKIILTIKSAATDTNAFAFNGTPDLEEIELHTDSGIYNGMHFASYLPGLKKITGIAFDLSKVQWTYNTESNIIYFPTGSALEEIRFVKNSMSYAGSYQFRQHGKLSDESVASLANAMLDTNPQTISLHADVKDRLSGIMGIVTDGVFDVSASGTTTLLDFITSTKGWTVA